MGWVARGLALGGAAVMVAALFVPTATYGGKLLEITSGFGLFRATVTNAVLPVVAAIVIAVLALVPSAGRRSAAAIAGLGGAVALNYLSYVVAFVAPEEHSPLRDLRAGFFVGVAGGILALVAGLIGIAAPESQPAQRADDQYQQRAQQVQPATAPSGWYPDPSGLARERYWDGHAWTEAAR
jgi:hypothetical protein